MHNEVQSRYTYLKVHTCIIMIYMEDNEDYKHAAFNDELSSLHG